MHFRPCIDIHNGKVKQIVGGSLKDRGDYARENFVSEQDSSFYANLYKRDNCPGGHIILLNPATSPYYESTHTEAINALHTFPGGLQVGGGIHEGNALVYLKEGASHVIVTSYVFRDGKLNYDNLKKLKQMVGKENLVLDLSCRLKDGKYYVVTDRWQKFTDMILTKEVLDNLAEECDEFLIHAVDAEGKAAGIEENLATLLGTWEGIPVTYAGGVGSFADLNKLRICGENRLDVTIGSALDLFGGDMSYEEVLKLCEK